MMTLIETLRDQNLSLLLGVHDSLSARLAQNADCHALWASSLGLSATRGLPDDEIITMTEILDSTLTILRATNLPVLVDCDTGFGSSEMAARLTFEASLIGIQGICIQDQRWPKRNSFESSSHGILHPSEFADRIKCATAIEPKQKRPIIVARTEALAQGYSVNEALERADIYANAGADAILLQSIDGDLNRIRNFTRHWTRTEPIGLIATAFENTTFMDFVQSGLNFVIYANQGLRASVAAMVKAYTQIKNRKGRLPLGIDMASIDEVLRIHTDYGK